MAEKYSWNLDLLGNNSKFSSERKEITKKVNQFVKKWRERKDYLGDPKVLSEVLKEYEKVLRFRWPENNEAYYFWLKSELDQTNSQIKAKLNDADDFAIKLINELEFFTLKIAKIKKSYQSKFLKAKELLPYKHFLEKLFTESDHLLSEKEEKILNLKNQVAFGNWVKMTEEFLTKEEKEIILNGKKQKLSFSEILSEIKNQDKTNRNNAAKAFNEILEKYSDLAEIELNSVLQNKKIDDDLRGFKFPESSRLLSDDIEKEIVDMMIKTVSKNYDISAKVYELKAKLFKVKKLQYHERNVDYGKINKKYSFNEAVTLVKKVLGNLDKEFLEIFELFLKNEQIDVFPKKGKQSGAFCQKNLITQPTYILLNFTEKLDDVITLAHELGHGINNELMRKNVSSFYFHNSLAIAEVASTFMEDFVLDEVAKSADDELKLGILIQKLDREVSSIFRQIACFQFEQELHQTFRIKKYLSKKEIGQLFQKHMAKYMGEFVEQSKGSENWWVYWGHIRNYFYNYSYANGLLISKSLQNMVRKNSGEIDKIKNILSYGTSLSPKNIFEKEGIDISNANFWQNGLQEIKGDLLKAQNLAKKLKLI